MNSTTNAISQYTSKFDNWDERATVRVKPRRVLMEEEEKGKVFFPPDLVPITQHPIVREMGSRVERELLIRHLFHYLDFTTYLEHDLVNTAARRIAINDIDYDIPEKMRFDAYKLYCDEAYHALFSEDMKRQIACATGVREEANSMPTFLSWCREIQASQPRELFGFFELFFATIAETLISSSLVQIPRDTRVITAVRTLVADHAEDEAFHFKYFSSLFRILWPQMSKDQKGRLGPLLPEFIMKFLQPDRAKIRLDLTAVGLTPEQIDQVVRDSYSEGEVLKSIIRTARMPLRLFEELDVKADTRTAEAFDQFGLAVPVPTVAETVVSE